MCFRRRCLVFFPYLNSLVTFSCDHPQRWLIKFYVENCSFRSQRAWLHWGPNLLEVMAASPVKEKQSSVISSTNHHIVLVDRDWVDDSSMIMNFAKLMALRQLPYSNFISTCACKWIFIVMERHRSHTFFVVCQCLKCFTLSNIPQPNHSVCWTWNDLGLISLSKQWVNLALVPS